jgi:predicted enzyme related to lactoylglutathione lyase
MRASARRRRCAGEERSSVVRREPSVGGIEIVLDAVDADAAAAFWEEALGYRRVHEHGPFTTLAPPEGDLRPRLVIQRVEVAMPGKTAVHLDLIVSDVETEVARLEGLGASVAWRVDETDRGGTRWTTMAAPHGTLFCVRSNEDET